MELADKYVYEVYKERSFSAAAKSLYVSQPALSTVIGRLEKELGIRIFDRSKLPLTLTPQGRIYIDMIEEIIESESNMQRRIHELSDMSYGTLSVGGSSHASYFILPQICSEFYKRHPKIKVNLDIGNTGKDDNLWAKLHNGELDLLLTYLNGQYKCIAEPFLEERLVIVMHKEMKNAQKLRPYALTCDEIITGNYLPEREIQDLSIFSEIEFIKYKDKSDICIRMHQMLGNYKTCSYSIYNARHSEVHYNLMSAKIGAVVASNFSIIQKQHEAEDLLYFVPKCKESRRTIYIAKKPTSDDNPIVKQFLQTAKAVFPNSLYK